MSDTVDLDAHRPHKQGPMICLRCGVETVNVRPDAMGEPCECGSCGATRVWSLDGMLTHPEKILGETCCGDTDASGTCAAPACLYGEAMNLIKSIKTMVMSEFTVE